MSNVDLDRLDALFAAANLSELSSHHIVNDGWRHLANLCTAPDKPCFVLQHRKEVMDWFAAMHNEFTALAAELRTLRARVAELEESNGMVVEYNEALRAERDRLRAELAAKTEEQDKDYAGMREFQGKVINLTHQLNAAQAEAAGLREALALTNNCGALDDPMWTAWKEANSDALARTPDQHRARIEAARLREAEVRG